MKTKTNTWFEDLEKTLKKYGHNLGLKCANCRKTLGSHNAVDGRCVVGEATLGPKSFKAAKK